MGGKCLAKVVLDNQDRALRLPSPASPSLSLLPTYGEALTGQPDETVPADAWCYGCVKLKLKAHQRYVEPSAQTLAVESCTATARFSLRLPSPAQDAACSAVLFLSSSF